MLTFEMQLDIRERIDRLEELIKMALPELQNDKAFEESYLQSRFKGLGLEDVPVSEAFTKEEYSSLCKLAQTNRGLAIYSAFMLGFANGVEYERKS